MSAARPKRNRPFDPEFEALLAEGYIEESSEGEELSELFAEASWEALQLVDPD